MVQGDTGGVVCLGIGTCTLVFVCWAAALAGAWGTTVVSFGGLVSSALSVDVCSIVIASSLSS